MALDVPRLVPRALLAVVVATGARSATLTGPFVRVTREGERGLDFVHVDTTSPIQFFDLRVCNECEVESVAEYPAPGRDDDRLSCP